MCFAHMHGQQYAGREAGCVRGRGSPTGLGTHARQFTRTHTHQPAHTHVPAAPRLRGHVVVSVGHVPVHKPRGRALDEDDVQKNAVNDGPQKGERSGVDEHRVEVGGLREVAGWDGGRRYGAHKVAVLVAGKHCGVSVRARGWDEGCADWDSLRQGFRAPMCRALTKIHPPWTPLSSHRPLLPQQVHTAHSAHGGRW